MEMHPECRFIEPAATCELLRRVESEDRRAVAMGPWPCALHKGSHPHVGHGSCGVSCFWTSALYHNFHI